MDLNNIEVGKLYLMWDGELHECIDIRDSNPLQYTFCCITQVSDSGGKYTNISTVYGNNVLRSMIEREATEGDIFDAEDSSLDYVSYLEEQIGHYKTIVTNLASRRNRD